MCHSLQNTPQQRAVQDYYTIPLIKNKIVECFTTLYFRTYSYPIWATTIYMRNGYMGGDSSSFLYTLSEPLNTDLFKWHDLTKLR